MFIWSNATDKELIEFAALTHKYRSDLSSALQVHEANDYRRLMKQADKLLGTSRGIIQAFRLGGVRGTAIAYLDRYGHVITSRI